MSDRGAAIVTGANGLTGLRIIEVLSNKGYRCVGIDLGSSAKGDFAYKSCDISDVAALKQTVADIVSEFGGVDVLINNAGIWHGKSFFEITEDDWMQTMDVNAKGMFFLTQNVARTMIDAGRGGAIVNIGSIVGDTGSTVPDYGASKAAVMNLTKAFSKQLGPHGIRVNAVSPGTINTAMGEKVPDELRGKLIASTSLKRAAEPEEIANVVGFLVSQDASYVTGAIVNVNGGL